LDFDLTLGLIVKTKPANFQKKQKLFGNSVFCNELKTSFEDDNKLVFLTIFSCFPQDANIDKKVLFAKELIN